MSYQIQDQLSYLEREKVEGLVLDGLQQNNST